MSDKAITPDERARSLLLWARRQGFRISELTVEGLRLVVDDLRPVETAPPPKGPRNAHEAWGQFYGVDIPPEELDDEDDEPHPTRPEA